ncbi:MAG: HlyD family efflux transporter periplasmic adaptor subunit [Thermoguttaceae bacterium]|nr:HlyD family efflux transporter periplasmic adaptor subunit [Thermoguttaceae bacterium]
MSSRVFSTSIALLLFSLIFPPAFAATGEETVEDKPATESVTEKPAEEKSSASKPAAEKPADEKPAEKKEPTRKPETSKPETHKVARGPLVIQLSLEGVFEARRMHELVLRPETWSAFKVVEAAEHGDRVDKGQVVIRFETDDIDRALADLRRDVELNKLTFKVAELELKTLERLVPMNLAAVDRERRHTKEDLQFYLKTEGPLNRRTADVSIDLARQTLEYYREELAQLEKMYEADELTEETEEIVLRRARNAVARAEFMLERAEIFHERSIDVELPRREESVKESAERAVLESELNQAILPLRLEQVRVEFEKAKVACQRAEERLAKLESDRELMTLKAPAEGVVYYGRCVDGAWRRGSSAEGLRRSGSISANDVFMTIVEPRPLVVRASVVEKHLADLKRGLRGTATPGGFPEMKLPVRLDRIARIPDAGTKFDAVFQVTLDLDAESIMPGMTCKMDFTPYRQRRALTVPPKSVFTDEWDPQKRYVWLYREGAKPQRQPVVLGRQTDDKAEVIEGLEAGDEILTKAPEDDVKK